MITIFTGAPGAGKSSLSALFLKRIYKEEGRKLQKLSAARIDEINKTRRYPLTPPPLPPIYSDFKVKIPAGYKKHYEPYYINGYYMGLANERLKTQFLPPYAKVSWANRSATTTAASRATSQTSYPGSTKCTATTVWTYTWTCSACGLSTRTYANCAATSLRCKVWSTRATSWAG